MNTKQTTIDAKFELLPQSTKLDVTDGFLPVPGFCGHKKPGASPGFGVFVETGRIELPTF